MKTEFSEFFDDHRAQGTKRVYNALLPLKGDAAVKDQFGWVPVSVFKPERREGWRDVIGDDGDKTTRRSSDAKYLPGLRFSEFHPHLADIVVRYWSVEGDLVVDPFAGRATRGLVSLALGRRYQGYEVAPTTFKQTEKKVLERKGKLQRADGCTLLHTKDEAADLVFTCPPYHRLERYEKAPEQLSELQTYKDFLKAISRCAHNCARVLKAGKFLCWVCADWREGGKMRCFHKDSIDKFENAGLDLHDVVVVHNGLDLHDVVVVHNLSPFAAMQTGKVAAYRYTSKVHEYLLVFRKPE